MIAGYRLCIMVYVGALVWGWFELPDRVPVRFDASGDPSVWRSAAYVLGAFMVLGAAVVGTVETMLRVLPARADRLGLPHPEWWTRPENLARFRDLVRGDVAWIGVATMALLTVIVVLGVRAVGASAAAAAPWGLGRGGVVAVLGFALAVLSRLTWMFTTRYRPGRHR